MSYTKLYYKQKDTTMTSISKGMFASNYDAKSWQQIVSQGKNLRLNWFEWIIVSTSHLGIDHFPRTKTRVYLYFPRHLHREQVHTYSAVATVINQKRLISPSPAINTHYCQFWSKVAAKVNVIIGKCPNTALSVGDRGDKSSKFLIYVCTSVCICFPECGNCFSHRTAQ